MNGTSIKTGAVQSLELTLGRDNGDTGFAGCRGVVCIPRSR